MAKYELVYFNGKGRAEVTRLLFAAKGVDYKDERFAGNWKEKKSEMPQGALPVLIVDGKDTYGQSGAIDRYVARELGMFGSTNSEITRIDEIYETCNDIVSKIQPFMFNKENSEEKAKGLHEAITTGISFYEAFLVKCLKTNKPYGYLVGDQLTLADVIVYRVYDSLNDLNYLDGRDPEMKAHYERIGAIPGIAKWVAERPKTSF